MGKLIKKREIGLRVFLFALLAGGGFWWLYRTTSKISGGSYNNNIKGEKTTESFNFKEVLPETVVKTGENIINLVPEETRETIQNVFEEKIVQQGNQIIESALLKEEIKKTIEEATDQITGFPEKQKKDLEKQVIRQVCNDLLKETE
jgi:hypothetical protein